MAQGSASGGSDGTPRGEIQQLGGSKLVVEHVEVIRQREVIKVPEVVYEQVPYGYDLASFQKLDVVDTAYNFYSSKVGYQFVITGISIKANKLVSNVTDAIIIIYEATSSDSTTVSKNLFQVSMTSGDIANLSGLHILVNEGYFVNGKTDDDDIYMNILGYYIPVLK